ncbi:hypothetical protein PCANC_17118 [Puccinia coronata f. sp. avenae]|uniref:Uncharacterized protein n=1 Tax=Puccinia coronata f. sp. avenae TaxID=200324 RepID=A0A2N5U5B7_9BASI|nr:hypothetical protein PCANC_17118 [Puccinia coronata f. sp. avenae]
MGTQAIEFLFDHLDAHLSVLTLPEKLAQMVASEFTLDATIRFKLGRWATDGLAPEFESDGCI